MGQLVKYLTFTAIRFILFISRIITVFLLEKSRKCDAKVPSSNG